MATSCVPSMGSWAPRHAKHASGCVRDSVWDEASGVEGIVVSVASSSLLGSE